VRNFEQGINQQQAKLVLNLGQNITSTAQVAGIDERFDKVPLPGRQIYTKEEINDVLELLKTPGIRRPWINSGFMEELVTSRWSLRVGSIR
jgi:hypothetical protein